MTGYTYEDGYLAGVAAARTALDDLGVTARGAIEFADPKDVLREATRIAEWLLTTAQTRDPTRVMIAAKAITGGDQYLAELVTILALVPDKIGD